MHHQESNLSLPTIFVESRSEVYEIPGDSSETPRGWQPSSRMRRSLDTGYEERKGVVVRSHRKCNTERRRALCTPSLFVPCIMRKEALLIPCSPNLAPGVSITSFPPPLCLFLARPVSRLFALPRFSFRENSSLPIEQKKKIRLPASSRVLDRSVVVPRFY